MSRNTILIGIDPGFRSLGYAALCIAPNGEAMRVNDFGLFCTEKSDKKRHVLATEDHLRRARELAEFLDELLVRYDDEKNKVVAVCAEAMSWPRNAGTTAVMGIAWGVLAASAWRARMPILQASPQHVKKTMCGRKDATKEEIQDAIAERVPLSNKARTKFATTRELVASVPKTKREHPSDALAVAITCSTAEAVQIARRSHA